MADLLKFKYIPLEAGYNAEADSGVITQQLDGGPPRFRRVSSNNIGSVNCLFNFDELGYQYVMAFYRIWMRTPSKPFMVEMFLDDPEVKEYRCWFVPNSVKLTSKSGPRYRVSVQLFVESEYRDPKKDEFLVGLVDKDQTGIFNPLDHYANVEMPEHLGDKHE